MNETALTPKELLTFGGKIVKEVAIIVKSRKDRLTINGKQYLYFADWQFIGACLGITAYVNETREITREVKDKEFEDTTFLETIGFWARASAMKDGVAISAAEAECMMDEANWMKKPRFQVRSMAETRACAKALRQCCQWVVKYVPGENIAEEAVEEVVRQEEFPYE